MDVPPARLRTDVFLTLGGKVSSLLLGLGIVVVVARELGPSGQGLFAVAFSLTLVLVHLGGLGVTSANPYFAARERELRPSIVTNSLWLAGVLGFALVGVGILLKLVAPGLVEGVGWTALLVALAGIPAALAALFLQSILLGEGRVVAYNAVEVAQFALTLAAIAVGFWVFDFQVTGALAVVTGSRFGAALTYFILFARRGPWLARPDRALARRMLGYGLRAYVAIVVSYLVIRVDLLLVNAYLGSQEAGLYSVTATIADGMFVLPMVVGINLFPRVARGDPAEATAEVLGALAVLYGLLCLMTVPLAGPGIRLVFGEAFEGSVSLYYWLLPGIYCLGLLTLLAHHFAGRGYPIGAVAVWPVGLALNVALNVLFLPGRGAWVAAFASSLTYALLLVLHIRLFAQELGGYDRLWPRPRAIARLVRGALG